VRIIVGCRFVPGGRTAVTLCCGILGYARRHFVIATAIAGLIWSRRCRPPQWPTTPWRHLFVTGLCPVDSATARHPRVPAMEPG
jgi:hypothetical protein